MPGLNAMLMVKLPSLNAGRKLRGRYVAPIPAAKTARTVGTTTATG